MVKKRNRKTRKKYKKRGGASDKQLKECNERLEKQGVSIVKRRNMCIESDGKAGLKAKEEPAPEPLIQPITQSKSKNPEQLTQSTGVQSVIAPLEEEAKPSIEVKSGFLGKEFPNVSGMLLSSSDEAQNISSDAKLPPEKSLPQIPQVKKRRRKKRRTAKSYQRAASERNRRKQMKENKRKSKKGGRRTKRKKSRKSRR